MASMTRPFLFCAFILVFLLTTGVECRKICCNKDRGPAAGLSRYDMSKLSDVASSSQQGLENDSKEGLKDMWQLFNSGKDKLMKQLKDKSADVARGPAARMSRYEMSKLPAAASSSREELEKDWKEGMKGQWERFKSGFKKQLKEFQKKYSHAKKWTKELWEEFKGRFKKWIIEHPDFPDSVKSIMLKVLEFLEMPRG